MKYKKLLIIFFGSLGIFLILLSFWRKSPVQETSLILYPTPTQFIGQNSFPQTFPSPQMKQELEVRKNAVTFSQPAFSPPAALSAYQKSSVLLSTESLLSLATRLAFKTPPEKSTDGLGRVHFLWENETNSLQIIPQTGYIQYLAPQKQSSSGTITNSQEIITAAVSFLKQTGLYSSQLDITPDAMKYYQEIGGDEQEVESLQQATVIQVLLRQQVGTYSLVRQYGNFSIGSIWVTKEGQVVKLSLQYTPPLLSSKSVPILSVKEVQEKIREGQEALFIQGEISGQLDRRVVLDTVNFTSITLVYFDDQTSDILYPFYLLYGESMVKGQKQTIKALLPAIKQ